MAVKLLEELEQLDPTDADVILDSLPKRIRLALLA